MSTQRLKPNHHRVIRTTISLHPVVYDALVELVKKSGFGGISDYVATRARHDTGLDDFRRSEVLSAK